jgi:photosystem II stability/assembly factor-like uncharacterized protein
MKSVQSILWLGVLFLVLTNCSKDKVGENSSWNEYSVTDLYEEEFERFSIKDVEFITENVVYLVGTNFNHEPSRRVFRTTDGGVTWDFLSGGNCGAGSFLYSILSGANNRLFCSTNCQNDHCIYFSSNSGLGWSTSNCSPFDHNLSGIDFKLNDTCLFIDGHRSVNGGNGWTAMNLPVNTIDYFFKSVDFGVCVTYDGKIAVTTDLGITWSVIYSNANSSFETVSMPTSNSIVVGGENIMISHDLGNTWNVVSTINYIQDIQFADDKHGFAVTKYYGESGSLNGMILKTYDGGDTWKLNYLSRNIGFEFVKIVNDHTAFVGGTQNVLGKSKKAFILKTTTLGEE